MAQVKFPLVVAVVFLWIGFVCAISFLEAWLKFKAPGITLQLGLGIGRLVFNALNKVEWVFAISILSNFLWASKMDISWHIIFYLLPVLLLIVQTVWLLPTLDIRAEQYIQGQQVPPSNIHFYYIGMETFKVVSLFLFGITLFKNIAQ